MAIAMHSIPRMSAKPEQVFSSSKILISDQQNQLKDDIIEALECLKSWEKDGLLFDNSMAISHMDQMLDDLEEQSRHIHTSRPSLSSGTAPSTT